MVDLEEKNWINNVKCSNEVNNKNYINKNSKLATPVSSIFGRQIIILISYEATFNTTNVNGRKILRQMGKCEAASSILTWQKGFAVFLRIQKKKIYYLNLTSCNRLHKTGSSPILPILFHWDVTTQLQGAPFTQLMSMPPSEIVKWSSPICAPHFINKKTRDEMIFL